MSQAIWKFELPEPDAKVEMPEGAVALSVGVEGLPQRLVLWALVDPEADTEMRRFAVYGTGHPVPPEVEAAAFIGTTIMEGRGRLVWHVFDITDQ